MIIAREDWGNFGAEEKKEGTEEEQNGKKS